jgi:hypothetical protein
MEKRMIITDGIEGISLGEIKELFKLNKMSMAEAAPLLREFRDRYLLTDQQARNAFAIAQRIYDV